MHTVMQHAFDIASKADRHVQANPKVGAVIIDGTRIISEGTHEVYGGPHAEINALNAAREPVAGKTMVVTLEPCSHHGKTPPCVEAIKKAKIEKVIIGTLDPNPLVAGKGVQILKAAGIDVEVLDTKDAQDSLNADYLKKISTKKPYITLKSAVSLDGKMALKNGDSKWITSDASRAEVQRMRQNVSAIMTGVGTILADDPRLTVHDAVEDSPVRIILDTHLKTPLDAYVVKTAHQIPTWIMTGEPDASKLEPYTALGVRMITVSTKESHLDLKHVFDRLAQEPLKHILIESGPTLTTSLLNGGWVDRWVLMMAPKLLGADAKSLVGPLNLLTLKDALSFTLKTQERLGPDIALTLEPERKN